MKFINSNIVDIDIDYDQTIDELIVQNCPKLNSISANGCKLKNLVIEDCPKLTNISAYGNKLDKLELKDFPELTKVFVPFNFINELEIGDCPKLETFHCNNNHLKKLEVRHLKNLKALHCYKNWDLEKIICKDLTKLEEMLSQECNLMWADFTNCRELKKVDLAENKLYELYVEDCKKLEWFSCRDNYLTDIDISNNKELYLLSIYNNQFSPMDISKFSHLTKMENLLIGLYFPADNTDEKNEERVELYSAYNRWYGSLEAFKNMEFLFELIISATDIDSGLEYLPLKQMELFCCEPFDDERKVKIIHDKWQEMRVDSGYASPEPEPTEPQELEQDKPVSLADFEIPADKDTIVNQTIAGERLTGKLIIEDWPLLKSLNVGNNQLVELEIRNCPNLKTLIYSHNQIKKLTIENCPNLTTKYSFDSDGYILPEEIDPFEKAFIELERAKREAKNKIYLILKRDENGENVDIDELFQLLDQININLIDDPEYRDKFIALYGKKLKELKAKIQEQEKSRQQTLKDQENNNKNKELVIKIANLIEKAQQALGKNDLEEVKKILNEMKTYCDTDAYANNKELIAKLEQQLINATSQSEPNNKTPNLPLIIGFLLVSLGILVLLLKFLQNKLKKNA